MGIFDRRGGNRRRDAFGEPLRGIADASEEVMNGAYNQFQLGEMIDKTVIMQRSLNLINLTYQYSKKELPAILAENLMQLPGGEKWSNRRN